MAEDKIRKLIDDIPDGEDRHLIDEAVLALKAGAFRAAYIMTWIAAAESLKRRINIVAERDSVAGKVLGDIEDGEKKHFAVDGKIVDGAFKLGLISDIEKTRLVHIFENRNVFGHPYNTAPNEDDVCAVIRYVVETILMREIKFKHSYVDDRLNYLLNDKTYLDDDVEKVEGYAEEVAKRVDDAAHEYLFKNYIEGLSVIWNDPEKWVLRRRGMRFCKAYLISVGVGKVVSNGRWLDLMSKYPEMLSWFASWEPIFLQLDTPSQDSAVLKNIEYAKNSGLKRLKRFNEMEKKGVLSKAHIVHLNEAFSRLSGFELHESGVPIGDLYGFAMAKLEHYDFGMANQGANFFFTYRVDDLNELTDDQQQALGFTLCDAACMNANEALNAVDGIAHQKITVPDRIAIGYCERFFTERIANVLSKESLCRNSIALLFRLPAVNRVPIESAFAAAVDGNSATGCMLKSGMGKYFADAYEAAKNTVLLAP